MNQTVCRGLPTLTPLRGSKAIEASSSQAPYNRQFLAVTPCPLKLYIIVILLSTFHPLLPVGPFIVFCACSKKNI